MGRFVQFMCTIGARSETGYAAPTQVVVEAGQNGGQKCVTSSTQNSSTYAIKAKARRLDRWLDTVVEFWICLFPDRRRPSCLGISRDPIRPGNGLAGRHLTAIWFSTPSWCASSWMRIARFWLLCAAWDPVPLLTRECQNLSSRAGSMRWLI